MENGVDPVARESYWRRGSTARYLAWGRAIQPETICVLYEEKYEDFLKTPLDAVLTQRRLESSAYAALLQLRSELPKGYVAFVGSTRFKYAGNVLDMPETEKNLARVELALGPGETQFDIIRLAETEPTNYGMTTEEVIAGLQAVDNEVGVKIDHAMFDALTFTLNSTPKNKAALAKKIVRVCPELFPEHCLEAFPDLKPTDASTEKYNEFVQGLEKGKKIEFWWR